MSGYSVDLRERVIKAWENGKTQAWIAATFSISVSSIKRYISRYKATGSMAPTQQGREQPLIKESDAPAIRAMVKRKSDARLAWYCAEWTQATGVKVSPQTMSRALLRFGLPRKKDGQRL
jgi:transposase